MGRPKLFDREDVLKKAIPVFWMNGFSDTSLQDLEKATGVNKSGLYSEFKDKDDIFVESLKFYYNNRAAKDVLNKAPLGWNNIETLIKLMTNRPPEQKGCFGVNCMRELEQLPSEARDIVVDNRNDLKGMFIKNIKAEKTKTSPENLAELISTFTSGLCIEQNLKMSKAATLAKVDDFMDMLKAL